MQIGDVSQGGIVTNMQILASNSTVSGDLAVDMTFGSVMNVNFTFDDFLLFKHYSGQ